MDCCYATSNVTRAQEVGTKKPDLSLGPTEPQMQEMSLEMGEGYPPASSSGAGATEKLLRASETMAISPQVEDKLGQAAAAPANAPDFPATLPATAPEAPKVDQAKENETNVPGEAILSVDQVKSQDLGEMPKEFEAELVVTGMQRLSMRGAIFEDGIRVDSVGAGPFDEWNRSNPEKAIGTGDMIVAANDVQVYPGMKLIEHAVEGKLRLKVLKSGGVHSEDSMEIVFEDDGDANTPPIQQRLIFKNRPLGFVVKNRTPIVICRVTGKGPHADRLKVGMRLLSFNGIDATSFADWPSFLEKFQELTMALSEL